jgi:oxygen-independent coproporphyrinogen III oxidase
MEVVGRGPRAAYIHVPFCAHHCGYCNFTVITGRAELIGSYLAALQRELSWLETPRPVDTVFIGGGTPTWLSPPDLEQLLRLVRAWFPPASGERRLPGESPEIHEWTVEANPGGLDAERLAILADHGVTRLSLGAQSFHPDKLRALERDHSPDDIRRAVAAARPHFDSISLDLIFGAPGETLAEWCADVEAALQLAPDHLSTYGLTYERGTTFWGRRARGELVETPEELERTMYAHVIERLASAGFEHYEVSSFARPGHRCRHNETYWAAEGYYAAGPGAARFVAGRREVNHRSTTTWLARVLAGKSPVAESEQLAPADRAREALVLGLRRLEGVDRQAFQARTGFELDELIGPALRRFVDLELLSDTAGRLRLTRAGLFVSDSIWPTFLRV